VAARTQRHLQISSHPSSCQLPEAEEKMKKPMEEPICSEADLKEKRERQIRKP
jgi:hypothetical protein